LGIKEGIKRKMTEMTPEIMENLKAMRAERNRLGVLFNEARDNWTKACSDLNYAMLEQVDYYQYIRGITKICPAWVRELKGEKPKEKTQRQIDEMVNKMLKLTEDEEVETKEKKTSFKSLW